MKSGVCERETMVGCELGCKQNDNQGVIMPSLLTQHTIVLHMNQQKGYRGAGSGRVGERRGGSGFTNSLGFERLLEANHVHDVARRSDVQQLHETATWLVNGLERWVTVSETLEI